MEWISVKDELPKYGQRVLIGGVWDKKEFIIDGINKFKSIIHNERGRHLEWDKQNGIHLEVTHWMPLPEPPKTN